MIADFYTKEFMDKVAEDGRRLRICGTCACHRYDVDGEDYVCINSDSENFADWTAYDDVCPEWAEKTPRR